MNKNLSGRPTISGAPFRKHLLLANVTLATASLCLFLIIAELVLRSVIPLDSRQPLEFRIPDPILGWALQPNTTYQYETPEGIVSVTYSSEGWRDLEHHVEKPDEVFRILVLGDSFMEANSVQLEESFHRQVEEFALAAGKKVEVINMGVAGYGTLQEYLVFEHIGHLYNPDLVLVGFYDGNDLINNSFELASILTEEGQAANARPFLDMNQSAHWTITPVDFEGSQRNYAKHKYSLEANRNKLTQKSVLLRLLTAGIARISNRESSKSQESQPESVDKNRRELALMGVNYCVEPAEYSQAWGATKRIFARFKEEVEAHGGRLVVFTVPALEEVSLEYMKAVTANVAYPEKLCLEETPGQARLTGLLTELDIEQISLLPAFRRVMREDGINLYQSDLHWNPKGHALAAESVVSELIRRGFLSISREEELPQ
jgi:acetyltransferase AlgX (SGNH hydrolase-like protein)